MVAHQAGLESPYLIASCDGDGFLLNTDMWAEDDLAQIAGALSVTTIVPPKTPVPMKQVRHDFPGALPFTMTHPNWTAIIVLVFAVPIVAAAMWAFGWWAQDDDDSVAADRQQPTSQNADLPREDAAAQNRLRGEAQEVFGAGTNWESRPPTAADCIDVDGWQRVLDMQSADGSSIVEGQDVRRELTDLAEDNGLVTVLDDASAEGRFELGFEDAKTGAFLRVRGGSTDGSDLSISSGSACASQ